MNYATTTDLAEYLGIEADALPTDAGRMLARAGDLMDTATMGRLDTSDIDHIEVAQKAVCAQCEYWINGVGESSDLEATRIKTKSIGKTSITYDHSAGAGAGAGTGITRLAPRARDILFLAGLLSAGVDLL